MVSYDFFPSAVFNTVPGTLKAFNNTRIEGLSKEE